MPLDSNARRELASRANRLKAHLTISADDLSDGAVEHVRTALGKHDLVKVRIATADRDRFRAAATALAKRVPCDIVQELGRVVTLHRPLGEHATFRAD